MQVYVCMYVCMYVYIYIIHIIYIHISSRIQHDSPIWRLTINQGSTDQLLSGIILQVWLGCCMLSPSHILVDHSGSLEQLPNRRIGENFSMQLEYDLHLHEDLHDLY